jgi:hypothetical protein
MNALHIVGIGLASGFTVLGLQMRKGDKRNWKPVLLCGAALTLLVVVSLML